MNYKIVAKADPLAIHSIGYHGESGRIKAQSRVDSGECGQFWTDKALVAKGFKVVPMEVRKR